MIRNLIFLVFMLISISSFAQNLVIDGSFEDVNILETNKKHYYVYNQWTKLMPYETYTALGLPKYSEYLKNRTITEDSIINSWYQPHTGDSYLICAYPFFKNLYQSELLLPLQKDSIYVFEMYYKLIVNNKTVEDIRQGQIGVYFSNHDFRDSTIMWALHRNQLQYTPHITIKEIDLSKLEQWVKFSYEFKADKDYKYMIIGNHQPLIKQTKEIYTKREGITYRIDDVSLTPKFEMPQIIPHHFKDVNKGESIVLNDIHFELNSSILKNSSDDELKALLDFMKKSKHNIEITGHTDNTGTRQNNDKLSEERAKAVFDYLVQNGIAKERMTYQGLGSRIPIADNNTEAGRQKNRRVEIKIQ